MIQFLLVGFFSGMIGGALATGLILWYVWVYEGDL